MNRAQPKPTHDQLCRRPSQVFARDAGVSKLLRIRPTCQGAQAKAWCNQDTGESFLPLLTLLVLDVTFNEALPLKDVVRELFAREGDSFATQRVVYGFSGGFAVGTDFPAANIRLVTGAAGARRA